MSSEYPIFKYNNKIVILKPGEQFTIRELTSRLNLLNIMNKYAGEYQDKTGLKKLYDLALEDDKNKILLFEKLKKDTELYNKYRRNNQFQGNDMQIPVENMIKNDKEVNLLNNDKVHLLRANRIIESNLDKKNDDEVSLFSMFNDYYSKISNQILYHVIFGFVVIFTTLSLLYIYRIYSEEINNIASLVFSSIINFNYYWYLIPFICIFLFLYLFLKYGKKIKIKKIIKKLVKKFKGNSEKNNINEI
jgi:hypothetical protein